MKKRRTIRIATPTGQSRKKQALPFDRMLVQEKGISFSFSCFDRTHPLFNLGANKDSVSGGWFIALFDSLKSIGTMNLMEMQKSNHELHRINWTTANAHRPDGFQDVEWWQFRIDKSKGRVIGFIIDSVYYVHWLDPHHNLTNSEGYGRENWYKAPKTAYEKITEKAIALEEQNKMLRYEKQIAEEWLERILYTCEGCERLKAF